MKQDVVPSTDSDTKFPRIDAKSIWLSLKAFHAAEHLLPILHEEHHLTSTPCLLDGAFDAVLVQFALFEIIVAKLRDR